MWQRIQTIFLLLTMISMIVMLFLPLWTKNTPEGTYAITPFSAQLTNGEAVVEYFPYLFVGCLAVLSALIAFYEVTRFKNRLTQMKLGALNSLVMSVVLGLSVYFMIDAQQEWFPEVQGTYKLGLFMPAIAMIFNMLANRFIRKDEKLVRSVDRIR